MALDFIRKEHYNTEDLIRIVALLRAPGGCPWDQAQTHASIKKNFIEETYEVIEAINRQSTAGLQEELGDVLLQVALHAQMEAEAGRFDFNDVADGICKKLIFRHPHVFGDVKAENTDDALASWDAAKLKEKGMKKVSQSMVSIPRELPALMRAKKCSIRPRSKGLTGRIAPAQWTSWMKRLTSSKSLWTKESLAALRTNSAMCCSPA